MKSKLSNKEWQTFKKLFKKAEPIYQKEPPWFLDPRPECVAVTKFIEPIIKERFEEKYSLFVEEWEQIGKHIDDTIDFERTNNLIVTTLKEEDGTYVGETKFGLYKHGIGAKKWNSGCIFDGYWENDSHKHGLYIWATGNKYTGTFKPDGSIEDGEHESLDGQKTMIQGGKTEYEITALSEISKTSDYQNTFQIQIEQHIEDKDFETCDRELSAMIQNNEYIYRQIRIIQGKSNEEVLDDCEPLQTVKKFEQFVTNKKIEIHNIQNPPLPPPKGYWLFKYDYPIFFIIFMLILLVSMVQQR